MKRVGVGKWSGNKGKRFGITEVIAYAFAIHTPVAFVAMRRVPAGIWGPIRAPGTYEHGGMSRHGIGGVLGEHAVWDRL